MGRHKPEKPCRPRPGEPHAHQGWGIPPPEFPPPGQHTGDDRLLAELTGAVFEGCESCREALLALLDPGSAARLVDLACTAVALLVGGIPSSRAGAPGQATAEFCRLARTRLGGTVEDLYEECGRMTPAEHRAAAATALDTLAGYAAVT